ncbi:unnamed protein product [Peniophora sp. CBMAI 1063]|nr:unnamed protein product [Peniophora sp. CBMAI 1063]
MHGCGISLDIWAQPCSKMSSNRPSHISYMDSYSATFSAWKVAYSSMLPTRSIQSKDGRDMPRFQQEFSMFLLNRPELAIHYLCELLRIRNEPGAPPTAESHFVEAVCAVDATLWISLNFPEHNDDGVQRTRKNWSCWLRAGLPVFCKEAFQAPDYFGAESAQALPGWQVNVIVILAAILSQTTPLDLPSHSSLNNVVALDLPPDELSRVLDETHAAQDALWPVFWKRHSIFEGKGIIRDTEVCMSQIRTTGELLCLLRCNLYQHWAVSHCYDFLEAPTTVWLRKIALLLWLHSDDDADSDDNPEPRWALLPRIFAPYVHAYEQEIDIDRPELVAFVCDELLSRQTAEAFFLGVRAGLGQRQLWGSSLNDIMIIIYILITSSTTLLSSCVSARVFSEVPLAIYRHEHNAEGGENRKIPLQRTVKAFYHVLHGCATKLEADSDTGYLLIDCKFFDVYYRTTVSSLSTQGGVDWAIAATKGISEMVLTLCFRHFARYHELQQAISAMWYRVLKRIRDMSAVRPADESLRTLIVLWREFGTRADLNEKAERRAYDDAKLAAQKCAWTACEWHKTPPSTSTRLCVGCGEVRYCSKACQVKDWKEGGHKARCRRLKAPAPAG